MLQSFFNGLSGMFSFSRGLDNVSNNIANMNTPGFRGSETFFRSVNGTNGQNFGSTTEGTDTRTGQGETRNGNQDNLAINGEGFFVLRDDNGALFYTRAGQFSFDENNTLVDTVTGMDVMGMSDSNTLQSIDLTELRILLPEATSEIQITGNLQPTSNSEEITEISIFDVRGEAQTISLHFTNPGDSDDIWNIEVRDSDGNSLGTDSIQFSNNGSLLAGANQFNMDLTLNDVTQNISFLFGEPGSTSQTTQSINLTATLTTQNVNGSAITGLTSSIFNNEGILELTYGNGESATGPQVALATFANEGALIADAGALYTANNNNAATLGRAGDPNFGGILSGRYELSNVDLTQEFADILIIQRGFQASSRVMSVSNELIEQLYNSTQ